MGEDKKWVVLLRGRSLKDARLIAVSDYPRLFDFTAEEIAQEPQSADLATQDVDLVTAAFRSLAVRVGD